MAYDAAVGRGVDEELVKLYVAGCVKSDSAWYVENANLNSNLNTTAEGCGSAGLSRTQQREMEAKAVDRVYERLEEFLGKMDVEHVVTAPCVSEEAWKGYVEGLETFVGPATAQSKDEAGLSAQFEDGLESGPPLGAMMNVPGTGGGEDRFEELHAGGNPKGMASEVQTKINGGKGYANVGCDTVTV